MQAQALPLPTVFPPLPSENIALTPDILYGVAPEGTVCHYHPHFWRFTHWNPEYPNGYYVFLEGKWAPFAEDLRAAVLDSNFESYEHVEFEELPMAVWISPDGQFAQQTAVDFCQYARVMGGWIHSCDLDQKKRAGFMPCYGMWVPVGCAES